MDLLLPFKMAKVAKIGHFEISISFEMAWSANGQWISLFQISPFKAKLHYLPLLFMLQHAGDIYIIFMVREFHKIFVEM